MDEQIQQILWADVRTLTEAYLLDDELKIVEQTSYQASAGKQKDARLLDRVKENISYKTYVKLEALSEKKLVDFESHEVLRVFFDTAHKQILKTPRLQIQVAIEANDQLLSAIYSWIKKEVKGIVFLEIISQPGVVAGCIIVYQGVYRNYSVGNSLQAHAADVFGPIMAGVGKQG